MHIQGGGNGSSAPPTWFSKIKVQFQGTTEDGKCLLGKSCHLSVCLETLGSYVKLYASVIYAEQCIFKTLAYKNASLQKR